MNFIYSLINMLAEMAPYLLLGFLVAGLLYAFVPSGFYRRHLSRPGAWSVIKAALIGVPLPLCSCGVLPTAVSLRRNGASRGASTSFLIATPQTGVDSIAATYSLLGPAFAIIRPAAALLTAFIGGMLVNKTESTCSADCPDEVDTIDAPAADRTFAARLRDALRYGFVDMVQNIGKWLIIGLVIAAAITVFVPDGFFTFFASYPLLSMIAVVVVAVPMYVCSTGSIPIALSLMLKGLSPGAAFVLLMAGPAANFASIIIVGKSLGKKAAAIYLSTIIVGAIAIGLCIDTLMPRDWFTLPMGADSHLHCHLNISLFPGLCSALLIGLLIYALIFIRHNHESHNHNHHNMETTHNTPSTTVVIKGMTCGHCKAMVEKNLSKLPGVTAVEANLSTGETKIEGTPAPADIRQVVEDLGFTIQ
ncbi:MAG: heavy metal-associated domain-containing protein [Bacteroides sp.]|nr:heavy metal-associated domain-containing protein [Bacteroides sp.]